MRTLPIELPDDEIQPWHSLGGVEHICELHKSCTVLYGIFTELARLVYSTTDGRLIGTPDVVWDRKDTGIWIDTELKWEDKHPEFRPAIYIQLSQLKYEEPIPGYNGKVTAANRFAERHYEMKVSGQVTFTHVGTTIGEACALADYTAYALSLMQDPIRDDFCFDKFEIADRMALEKLQNESTDRYVSSVSFLFEYSDAWDVTEETPILKSLDILEKETEARYSSMDGEKFTKVKVSTECSRHATVDRDNILTENKTSG